MGLFDKKPALRISKVKYLGVRTGIQSKALSDYNFALYSFLIEYDDGSRTIVEYKADSKALSSLLPLISMD